jgi:predicted MPP superfamily phosphohydrolase
MFFSFIYKSPLWSDQDNKSRLLRVIACGVICYVVIHSYIFSKFVESNELVFKYRNYVFHLAGIDLMSMLAFHFKEVSKKKKNNKALREKNKKMHLLQYTNPNFKNNFKAPLPQYQNYDNDDKVNNEYNGNNNVNKLSDLFITQDTLSNDSIPVYKPSDENHNTEGTFGTLPLYSGKNNNVVANYQINQRSIQSNRENINSDIPVYIK